jgi:putative GTP pyrophosphokinase
MTTPELSYSKSRVLKAGNRVRDWLEGKESLSQAALATEVEVIENFRACHAAPLTRVAAGLRYYVARHSSVVIDGGPVVAQRLKRMRTIADKLVREPGMDLSRMYDIGGCRALFADASEMRALVADLETQRRWEIVRVRDYVESPRPESGYRAVHVIVRKDGILIECQLRTLSQHAWAELIEGTDRSTGVGLKASRAPADVTEYYRLGADLLAQVDAGHDRDPATLRRFQELHEQVHRRLRKKGNS